MGAGTNNIYDISKWKSGATYQENDIVKHNDRFWYSLKDNNQGNTPSVNSDKWGGNATDNVDGDVKPEFIWELSYTSSMNHQPNTTVIKFGSGYEQRMKKNINTDLLNFDAQFNVRSKNESAAILHFLHERAGAEAFLFKPPPPYSKQKLFVCRNWSPTFVFYDNNSITANFVEVTR